MTALTRLASLRLREFLTAGGAHVGFWGLMFSGVDLQEPIPSILFDLVNWNCHDVVEHPTEFFRIEPSSQLARKQTQVIVRVRFIHVASSELLVVVARQSTCPAIVGIVAFPRLEKTLCFICGKHSMLRCIPVIATLAT